MFGFASRVWGSAEAAALAGAGRPWKGRLSSVVIDFFQTSYQILVNVVGFLIANISNYLLSIPSADRECTIANLPFKIFFD
jgi:hypothetical protein